MPVPTQLTIVLLLEPNQVKEIGHRVSMVKDIRKSGCQKNASGMILVDPWVHWIIHHRRKSARFSIHHD